MSNNERTPADIAENRRLALEILKSKRNHGNSEPKLPVNPTPAPNQQPLSLHQKELIEMKRLAALERLAKNKAASKMQSPGKAESALKAVTSKRQHPYMKPNQNVASTSNAVNNSKPSGSSLAETERLNQNTNQKSASIPIFKVTCNFEMISEHRFEARLEKYSSIVIDTFKKINSKNYDNATKIWSFSLMDYENLLVELEKIKEHVKPEPIPKFVIKQFREKSPVPNQLCLQEVEPLLANTLLGFQTEGVCFGISRGGRFLLADDPGLGKTRQALAVADYFRADWPLLIVATASMRHYWMDQIFELLPNVNLMDIVTIDSNNVSISQAKVVICSYTGLDNHIKKLLPKDFGVVIFDESHNLKNQKSKQTINATKLGEKALRVILLSGTPALSRPSELYPQLAIIDKRFADFFSFAKRFCDAKLSQFGLNTNGASNLKELKLLLTKKMIRRTKDEVQSELGQKVRVVVKLPGVSIASASTHKMGNFSQNFHKAEVKKKEQHEVLVQWYTETAKLKAASVCSYIEEFIKKSNEKFIIFGHHTFMLDSIQERLRTLNINFVRIDGSTKPETRASNVQCFQLDSDVRCALLSIKACSTGITLTAASLVIFAELSWTPSDILQAEGRVHRIGQEKQVECYFLIAPGTSDDPMWKMLLTKQNNISKAGLFASNENFSTNVTNTNFEPGPSTSSKSHNKSITEYFAKTPKKFEKMDSSDSFHTCQTDFDDDEIEFSAEVVKNGKEPMDYEEILEKSFMEEASSYKSLPEEWKPLNENNNERPDEIDDELLGFEKNFLEASTYHTQLEMNDKNGSSKVPEVLSDEEIDELAFLEAEKSAALQVKQEEAVIQAETGTVEDDEFD